MRRRYWGSALLLLLLYVGVAVGTTYPLVGHLTTHLPGQTTDTLVHYWNGWWVRQALRNGQSPFRTSYLFYPQGLSLVYHNFAWPSILGWLALEPIVGGFAGYNLVFLLSLALCGWTASLLAYDLTGDRRAAFLSGLIYQCWPFRMAQLDHPNLISTYSIPLFLLFLNRTVRRHRWRSGVFAGGFLALVGYTRWQLLIPASIIGGIYLAFTLPRAWATRHQWLPPLLLAGSVAALALTPPAMLLMNEQQTNPASLVKQSDEVAMQTDLMAYLTPSAAHPIFGPFTATAYDRYYSNRSTGRRFPAYVGVATLALASLGIWRASRKSIPWVVGAVVLISLALGMDLRINGNVYPALPMPYRLASKSFLVRLLRFPDRFSLFVALPMSMLAAHGTSHVLQAFRHDSKRLAASTMCLLCGAVVFEYLAVPAPHRDPQASDFYREIAHESQEFAILNLPINSQKSKEYMFAQVTHQHPILQGKSARLPEGTYTYLDTRPLLRSLKQSGEIDPALTDVSRQLTSLADDDVAYIVLHKQEVEADRVARWRRYLLTTPRFEDHLIAAFSTSPVAGRDFPLAQELLPGIGPVHIVTSTGCLDPGGVLEVDIGWGTARSLTQDFSLEISLASNEGTTAESRVYALSSDWPTSNWPANALVWGYYPFHVSTSLPRGTYAVELALVDAVTAEKVGHSMLAGEVRVPRTRCVFPVPPGATSVNSVFGDALRLLGYRLLRQGDELEITLYWRSEQRMETDYKIFVHVFEPTTKAPVAQDDSMPKRWAHPTTLWAPGERVADVIPVSLKGVPQGEYGVAVGVYDPQTMERLPVVGAENRFYPDDRLILQRETVVVENSKP